jgi:hypothetical protein
VTSPPPLVIRPSWLVRHVMGPMPKVLNPLVKKVSGRKHMSMAATVYHQGRRSGRHYTTTTGARFTGDEFVIPLTFGTESDWCRNLHAAGGGRIRLKARTYEVNSPEVFPWPANPALVKRAYPAPMRVMLKALGIKAFIRLRVVSTSDQTPARSDHRDGRSVARPA